MQRLIVRTKRPDTQGSSPGKNAQTSFICGRKWRGRRGSILSLGLFLALAFGGPIVTLGQSASGSRAEKPLDIKNDPRLIGKRDINKGNLAFYSLDKEVAIGRRLAMEIDQSSQLMTDSTINEFINRIGQNLVLHSDAKLPFVIKVLDEPEVNAFALPGGFLYVNRGLLEAAENEAEVAGVLAHEIAHVTARHGIEQASKGELLNYASLPLLFLGGWGGYILQQVAGIAVPLTFLKFSRGAEREADRLGAQYMWASGYDPMALITFFEKLQKINQSRPGTISKLFSTHPMTEDRIRDVQALIRQFPDRGEYQVNSSEFAGIRSRLTSLQAGAAEGEIGSGRPTLRRRPIGETSDEAAPSAGDPATADGGERATTPRPVLRRLPSETPPADASSPPVSPQTGDREKGEEKTGRPVLKRHPDSGNF
jgi:predicted Zn-dependent protease